MSLQRFSTTSTKTQHKVDHSQPFLSLQLVVSLFIILIYTTYLLLLLLSYVVLLFQHQSGTGIPPRFLIRKSILQQLSRDTSRRLLQPLIQPNSSSKAPFCYFGGISSHQTLSRPARFALVFDVATLGQHRHLFVCSRPTITRYYNIMPSDGPPLLRPTPRRPFDLNVTSATPPESTAPADSGEQTSPNHLDAKATGNGGADLASFSRTRSILNLTSSTLFGIYSPTGYNEREEPSTPWGTGAETPRERGSFDGVPLAYGGRAARPQHRKMSSHHTSTTPLPSHILNLALRVILLFCFGMGYGVLVTHLHNDRRLAPFQVEGIMKPSYNWSYLVFWGIAGIGLGNLLPWVDTMWEDTAGNPELTLEKEGLSTVEDEDTVSSASGLAADWNPVVRSIGAFVGIAFAIVGSHFFSPLSTSYLRPKRRESPD